MTKYGEFTTYFPLEKLTKIVNLCKNGQKGPFFHDMTHILTVIFDELHVFHRGASKISKMTKYDEFINYFPVEKMAKIVKLCKNSSKSPFFRAVA